MYSMHSTISMFVRKSLFYDLNQHNRGDEPDFGKVRALGTTSTDAAFTKPKPEVKDPSWPTLRSPAMWPTGLYFALPKPGYFLLWS